MHSTSQSFYPILNNAATGSFMEAEKMAKLKSCYIFNALTHAIYLLAARRKGRKLGKNEQQKYFNPDFNYVILNPFEIDFSYF